MLAQDDFQRYMPDVAEIRRHLNIAILKSGVDIPEDACQHYFNALILMERLVHKVEHRAWDKLESAFTNNGSVSSPESSVLVELVSILSIGGAETAEDLQEFRDEFEEINRRLNIVVLSTEPAVAYDHFLKALLLMKSLAYDVEQMVWERLKAGLTAASVDSDGKSSSDRGGASSSAGTFWEVLAVGEATGAMVGSGGLGLAGAAAGYGLYKAGSWALETQQGQDVKEQVLEQTRNTKEQVLEQTRNTKEQVLEQTRNAKEQVREQTQNIFNRNPWRRRRE